MYKSKEYTKHFVENKSGWRWSVNSSITRENSKFWRFQRISQKSCIFLEKRKDYSVHLIRTSSAQLDWSVLTETLMMSKERKSKRQSFYFCQQKKRNRKCHQTASEHLKKIIHNNTLSSLFTQKNTPKNYK